MRLCGFRERAFSFLKVFDSLWGYANTVDERANNRKVYTIWSWGWHLHFRHSSKNFLWLTNNRLPIRLHPIMSQIVWPIFRIVTVSLLSLFWLIVILISKSNFDFESIFFFFSFKPKNERNCFLISALASKNGSIKKVKALY